MSISSSLYTGKSSIFCLEKKMGVLGDNIANISTTGFRGSRVSFEDILLETTGTGGVKLSPMGIISDFSKEGPTEPSHLATNMAISGDGFFILHDPDDTGSTYYTRAGEFDFDYEGYLVNPGGHIVQGYAFDSAGVEGTTLTDIQLELTGDPPRLVSAPRASSRLTILSNLDADALDHSSGRLSDHWTGTIPPDYYELWAEQDIYDSNGDTHSIAVYYDKAPGNNVWDYLITSEGDALARGLITFTSYGYIDDISSIENYQGGWVAGTISADGYPVFHTNFPGAANVEFDVGAKYDAVSGTWVNESQTTTTQFGQGSFARFLNVDGNGEGDLMDFSTTRDGILRARFDNGITSDLYRVVLAGFTQPSASLQRKGACLFQADEGSSLIGIPDSSGFGIFVGNSLEKS
ncbi:MAG: flagellar hook-basal body complex protein, partial [Desulfobacterales bacterium]|nr:flagellar hook-basal body complex protein [Desulfobacterales bacterium]